MNDKAIEKINPVEGFELAQRQAKAWANSSLVPAHYQGNVPNVLIAMEIAERIGASVMGVMQHLYIVHGKPSFEATFLIATVNASGRFSPVRYRMSGEEDKNSWGCRAWATDKESGEECVGPLVTIQMAHDEGWYSKKGSKWKTMPELMLMYRAAAFWTRTYAPELSMGIHTRDEMQDAGFVKSSPVQVIDSGKTELEQLTDKLKSEKEEPETDKAKEQDYMMELQLQAKEKHGENWKKWVEKESGLKLDEVDESTASKLLDMLCNE